MFAGRYLFKQVDPFLKYSASSMTFDLEQIRWIRKYQHISGTLKRNTIGLGSCAAEQW